MNELNKSEEHILFHTLGYDYEPRWNDNRGGYRNWFGTTSNSVDYPVIQTLIEKGYMKKDGNSPWGNEEVFSVTEIGKDYVIDLWKKKKKKNKPSRSKRRYQAYFDWLDCYNGSFGDFLKWLIVKEEDEWLYPKEFKYVKEFKKKWEI